MTVKLKLDTFIEKKTWKIQRNTEKEIKKTHNPIT